MTITYRGVAGVEDSGTEAMTTLYQQWYNTVCSGLRLDANTFQLLQPNMVLGDTSDQLWAFFNSIPPLSLVNNFQVNGLNRLYDDYRAVVNMLESQTGDQLRHDLGDFYAPWLKYVQAITPLPKPEDLPGIFFGWATINAPDVAARGKNDYEAMLDDPIALAQQAVLNQSGFLNHTPDFNQTIQDLRDAVASAPAGSLSFDSSTESSDTSHSWAKATLGGFWDFFEGEGTGDWDKTESKASSSKVTIAISFAHVLTFAAVPGAWYSSAALTAAFATRDNTLWKIGTPNWDSTFGPSGNMQRFVNELIVVDGITMTLMSHAGYDTDEQISIKTEAEAGFFPFFFTESSGGFTSNVSFDDSGTMTVTASSPAGNPVILGAVVSPAGSLLASK